MTLRENTERPETVDVGANVLAGAMHGCKSDLVTLGKVGPEHGYCAEKAAKDN